jgi:hypothetical protein
MSVVRRAIVPVLIALRAQGKNVGIYDEINGAARRCA